MSKIPTAEDFSDKFSFWEKYGEMEINYENVYKFAIEFAKLHVKAALEAAYNNHEIVRSKVKLHDYDYADSSHYTVEEKSILNAYPDKLIQ